jgi:uncharacterized repeat protein (TIGR01451 family)
VSPTPTLTPTPGGLACDLSITKTAAPNPVQPGQAVVYSIVAANAGPASALAVTLTDPLPGGVVFVSCQSSQGSCAGPPPGSGGTVTADLGTIPAGGGATLTITATVVAPAGSISNTATVDTSTPDTNPDNDSSTSIVVGGATIPTLSPGMLALFAGLLAAAGALVLRRFPF